VALPSPARTCGGEVAWRLTAAGVRVVRYGGTVTGRPVDERLEDFVHRHFTPARAQPGAKGAALAGKSGDGFPFVGPVPALNGVVACGYGTFGLGWAVLAARWAVDALVSGRDPTPARFKAARGAAP
jgi:glycine/D-amino acid oxidase-like deaminating enzyme